jgi:hypothetical protein
MELIKALTLKIKSNDFPFKHWEINQPLNREAIKEICEADIPDPRKDKLN